MNKPEKKIELKEEECSSPKDIIGKLNDTETYKLIIISKKNSKAQKLEIDSAFFNSDSAVFLPEGLVTINDKKVCMSGILFLMNIYQYIYENQDKKILIFGHTDSTDDDEHNRILSMDRALSIYYLLTNDRENWVKTVEKRVDKHNQKKEYRNKDIINALTWIANEARCNWDCHPGIDKNYNDIDDEVREAILEFRFGHNEEFSEEYSKTNNGNKYWGWSYKGEDPGWGAVFDVYQEMLEDQFFREKDKIGEYRKAVANALSWGKEESDTPYCVIGCGELRPKDGNYEEDEKSTENRRVEVMFVDPEEQKHFLDLPCHENDCPEKYCRKTETSDKCPIYGSVDDTKNVETDRLSVDIPPMELHFSIIAQDKYLIPLSKKSYTIEIPGETLKGETDGDGYIQHDSIPPGDYLLTINDSSTFIPAMPRSFKRRIQIVD